MTATELYQKGQLQEAITAQIEVVRSKPADHSTRLFLFELLAFSGDLDKAQKQLDVIKYDEMERETALQGYRKLLESERLRRKVFTEGTPPKFLKDPSEHVNLRLQALQQIRGNNAAAAQELINQADAKTPVLVGELNDKKFEGLRDADDLLGATLEVFAHGLYFWVPLDQVDTVAMNPPKFPRDLIWLPARLTMKEGDTGEVFLPTLYHGTHLSADNQIKLGRLTDWKPTEGGPVHGVGLKTFLVGEDGMTLLEWRQLTLEG